MSIGSLRRAPRIDEAPLPYLFTRAADPQRMFYPLLLSPLEGMPG